MESIIIIGHGSPKKDANTMDIVGGLLHAAIHPGCTKDCVKAAYLEFADPDIMGAISRCVEDGARKIIIHPYFLNSGMHVTKDIPETIDEARGLYPEVEMIYTEPLGIHNKLIQLMMERIRAAQGFLPNQIEERSMEIISEETVLEGIPAERIPIVKRVIHATADFEIGQSLRFHPDAVKAGIEAIRAGKDILSDVEMVRSGINKRLLSKWGGKVVCHISDDDVIAKSEETGRTRADLSMEKGLSSGNVGIVVIGNAPTALLKVVDILNAGSRVKGQGSSKDVEKASESVPSPDPGPRTLDPIPLVVGVPVGFVQALESKALLAGQRFPFITNLSSKGGTPVAVAIVNALLKMAEGGAGEEK